MSRPRLARDADLSGADLTDARLSRTLFAEIPDLELALGIDR